MKAEEQLKKLDMVKQRIKSYPDFPKPGILFRDIFAMLRDPMAFAALYDVMIDHVRSLEPMIQCVVGLEARGFVFGPLVALALQVPFVPIRKKGKLPGSVASVKFELEYGQDEFEVQTDSMVPNTNVLIIDDLLATGGTLAAACELMSSCHVTVVQCLVIMELTELDGPSPACLGSGSFRQITEILRSLCTPHSPKRLSGPLANISCVYSYRADLRITYSDLRDNNASTYRWRCLSRRKRIKLSLGKLNPAMVSPQNCQFAV